MRDIDNLDRGGLRMPEEPKLKYQWRPTGKKPDMYSGFDGPREIAFVHKYHLGWWNWYMCWNHAKNSNRWQRPNGQADSAREAALAAESCYDSILSCTWPGMDPEDLQCMLDHERWREGYKKLWREAMAEQGYVWTEGGYRLVDEIPKVDATRPRTSGTIQVATGKAKSYDFLGTILQLERSRSSLH
nr:hypothetical protein [Ensifer sp. IC4062]